MDEVVQKATDLWHQFASSPTEQTHALLVGILTVLVFKWRKKRTTVTVSADKGESVTVEIGRPAEAPVSIPALKITPDGFVKVGK